MIRIGRLMLALVMGLPAVVSTPAVAHADGVVMYEVISSYIGSVDVEYTSLSGQVTLQNVALPWRANVTVADPYSIHTTLRAKWPRPPERYKWVTIRIMVRGSLLCEDTKDRGNAACTARGLYGGEIPEWMPPMSPPDATGPQR